MSTTAEQMTFYRNFDIPKSLMKLYTWKKGVLIITTIIVHTKHIEITTWLYDIERHH